MNYLIPNSQSNTAAFVANSTLILGTYTKPVDARVLISVDYGQLVPAVTMTSYWYKVSPGGAPLLEIDGSALVGTALTFFISGGIGGQTYEVTVNATLLDGEIRSDTLTVNVLGDDCGCVTLAAPPVSSGSVSSDGSIIVNTAPRFFVSGTPPVGANIMDGWYNPTTDDVYEYISTGLGTEWVPISTSVRSR